MATKVKPIPEGLSTITPHLFIRGAAKAIDFYKKALGAEEIMRAPAPDGSLMHAAIRLGNSTLFLADPMGPSGAQSSSSLMVFVEDVDALWDRAIKAGCTVKMPLENQFWGDRYGVLSDPFGQDWQLATHVEDVSGEEMAKRGAKAFAPK